MRMPDRKKLWGVLVMLAIGLGFWLSFGVREARRSALRTVSQGPLNQLCLALHNYHDTYGQLPPAVVYDPQGKPLHSWRVLILPFIDEGQLYAEYDFSQPWDGPRNRQLFDRAPALFRSPTEPESTRLTNMVVIRGSQTPFPSERTTRFEDFADGLENTILLTEIAHSDIVWTEPRDLDIETMSFTTNSPDKPSISAVSWRRPYVVFADSIRAWAIPESMKPEDLRALTTVAGGEFVDKERLFHPK